MAKGIKINTGTAKALILLAGIATIGFLLACATARPTPEESPGMYGLTGWNGQAAWYDRGNNINVAAGIDINGEVGHPLYVGSCRTRCVPGPGWTANSRLISGSLPPGIDFEPGSSGITGIPTERGHWIVKVELYNVMCNGTSYVGVRQELRFHIGGSGRVVR